MQVHSHDFSHGKPIPKDFTCDGENISPHIAWTEAPPGVKSYALSCKDPDAPGGNWDHWLIVNIPIHITEIPQDSAVGEEITNDFGYTHYGGPCPPSGEHRYIFTVYALDTEKLNGVSKDNFNEQIKTHTINSAQLIGVYQRRS